MSVVLALAVAYALGVDLRRIALLAGAIYFPMVVGALIALHWFRARPNDSSRPAIFCEGVASELRAGAILRDALATAATSVESSALSADTTTSTMAEVAAQAADEFPSIGEELRLTVVAAARSGSDAAALFDEIGSLAIAQSEIRREVSVATAPGRVTALVLVGAPVIYLVSQMSSGGLTRMLASSQQRIVALIGLGLFVIGMLAAILVLWRAGR